jgi:uncharacterized membrane protein YfcA
MSERQTEMMLDGTDAIALFKFYEDAADKTKAHAWSQTTWLLTLNSGILAFSLDYYAKHTVTRGALLIECLAALVGAALCAFLLYLLHELGSHISHYWTTSNQIAAAFQPLTPFISKKDARAAREPGYRAPFPKFCRRLQGMALLFCSAHVGWAVVAFALISRAGQK